MRLRILGGVIFLFYFVTVLGLFNAQVTNYKIYRGLSEKNRIRILPLVSPRGKIYDRSKKLLVSNRIAFTVGVVYQELGDKEKILRILSDKLGIPEKKLSGKIEEAGINPFVPYSVADEVDKEKAIQLEEMKYKLQGVIVTARPMRDYLYGEKLSHVTGYLGKISKEELGKFRTYGYMLQDLVGKDGLEREYNEYLRGKSGGLQVEVDSKGRQLRVLALKEPAEGKDLYLEIDLELQDFCNDVLGEKSGAIIVMDPFTGGVLALASRPGYDPNAFVSSESAGEVNKILQDRALYPLLDRAIACAYPPGSVFKVVVAASVLDTGKLNETKTLFCGGSYRVGNRAFKCWKKPGHGTQSIREAIKNSCNVFFYQLGFIAGTDLLAEYARRFGFGEKTGIDLPGESAGFVPTIAWKKETLKESWFKGETANYAIGQGYLLVTPIQVLRMMAAVANGGELLVPHVVDRIENVELSQGKPQKIDINGESLEIIREGLRMVVNDPHGTGIYGRVKGVVVAGKTGTAENSLGKAHGWFSGFAPFEGPKLCLVVFVEHGGKGGVGASMIARKVIEKARGLGLL
ncbi:MAG: penicillin-binding protein 2 [Candidatus Omnitrophica bacterium]|nr:penicillin-binding protein 2 [Candidatus Omnitrophota bacterium]